MIIIAQKARAESPPPSLWMVSIAACDCSVTPASQCRSAIRSAAAAALECVFVFVSEG